MLYERRVKVKLDLTLQQPFTNVVITLCASWVGGKHHLKINIVGDCLTSTRFPLIYINFNFDFLDLHNVFF